VSMSIAPNTYLSVVCSGRKKVRADALSAETFSQQGLFNSSCPTGCFKGHVRGVTSRKDRGDTAELEFARGLFKGKSSFPLFYFFTGAPGT
jgi:hypothetical protein